jgi:hypothetical protein
VHRDDHSCHGELHACRRDPTGWVGYVTYAVSPGLRHLEWVNAERVRKALESSRERLLLRLIVARVSWQAAIGAAVNYRLP